MSEKRPKLVAGTEYVPKEPTPEEKTRLEIQKLEALVRKITGTLPEDYDTSTTHERIQDDEEVKGWPAGTLYEYLAQEDTRQHEAFRTAVIEEVRTRRELGDFSPRT